MNEVRYIEEGTVKGLWQYSEMGTERERCVRMEPRSLAKLMVVVVPVIETQRVETLYFTGIILSLRNL